jgi:superoxide reductase
MFIFNRGENLAELMEVYKCEVCGNVVEIVGSGAGQLVCCNQPMTLQEEKSEDAGMEKHLPVVESIDGGIKVAVGSVPHPMEDAHHIMWIEVVSDVGIQRKHLKSGDAPEAEFNVANVTMVRSYCNLHGLWVTKM